MSRYLITSAHESAWKFDRPVLFLGEWCRLYDRKSLWSEMDAIVATPYGMGDGQKARDFAYIQSIVGQLLPELAAALNAFHHTRHSQRYWHIVLGSWLYRYVRVVFNRYHTLEQALSLYEVNGTTVFESGGYSLATTDSLSFTVACHDDLWNHVLYSKILEYWGNVETELVSGPLQGVSGYVAELPGNARKNIKSLALKVVAKLGQRLCRRHDAFIINSYLSRKEEMKLQLSLGQFPQLWRRPRLEAVASNADLRRQFGLQCDNHQGFEHFVRTQLGEMLPSCFLEGYGQLVEFSQDMPWPSEPRFVYTSNNFDSDEVFKVWVGGKVERGIPYFAGQHGNNYGALLGSDTWPELVTSDRFFTWGWSNDDPRIVPAFVFKTAGQKRQGYDSNGGLLLIELHPAPRLGPEDDYFDFCIYQEEQFRFTGSLPHDISQQLTVRLHSYYKCFHWFDEQRWKDFNPHTRLETGTVDIRKLIEQSRLIVHSYDSTGILETLSQNIPTLCFWHGGLDHLLPSAKPYYELLRSAGILADTPEQAAKLVALHWNSIDEWWLSNKVQDARMEFCEHFARTVKNPVRTLKHLLTTYE